MKLSSDDRLQIETFAKEAARRHFQQHHPKAEPAEAMRFAVRSWRSPEFIQVGAEILAIWQAIDEAAAAPFN